MKKIHEAVLERENFDIESIRKPGVFTYDKVEDVQFLRSANETFLELFKVLAKCLINYKINFNKIP